MNDPCEFITFLPAKIIRDAKREEEQQREQVRPVRENVCPFTK